MALTDAQTADGRAAEVVERHRDAFDRRNVEAAIELSADDASESPGR